MTPPTAPTLPETATEHALHGGGVHRIARALRGPRILTERALAERVHADSWPPGDFETDLGRAIREGQVRRLGDELVEIAG